MGLDKYRPPQTESITLDDLPDITFEVVLPTATNKRFARATGYIVFERVDGAEPQFSDHMAAQVEAFGQTCVVSATGLPDGLNLRNFFVAYPGVLDELFDAAIGRAQRVNEVAVDATKKASPSPSGA